MLGEIKYLANANNFDAEVLLFLKLKHSKLPCNEEFSTEDKEELIKEVVHKGVHIMSTCFKCSLMRKINPNERCHVVVHAQREPGERGRKRWTP
jgi:hypothetical protein